MADIEASLLREHPSKVTRLLNSMEQTRKRIDELKGHLETAESEYRRLEIEWEEHQASVAPIRTCPNEILSIIFHFYLLENPRLVRRLLLVCKQWYAIAVHDPQMWNRISVTIPDEWDVESASRPIKRRIECCLERSGTLLLDLDLDLSELRSAGDQIIEKIRTSFLHDVSSEDWDALYDWSGNLDVEPLLGSATTTKYLPKYMLEAVRQLVGHKGEIMDRWGTVNLRFPEFNMPFVVEMWQIFAWPAPNLSSMVVRWSESMGEYLDALGFGFPDLPSLKHLDVYEIDSLEFLHLEHSSLESLVVHGGLLSLHSLQLSCFSHLQRLEVSNTGYVDNDLERFSLTLPRLCHFILQGDVEYINAVEFHVPFLRTLDLVRWHYFGFSPFPRLQSQHVRWKMEEGREEDLSPALILVEMKRILAQYSLAVKLTVGDFGRSAIIEAIRSLRVDGKWTSALETIVVKKPGGEEETFLVSSLC